MEALVLSPLDCNFTEQVKFTDCLMGNGITELTHKRQVSYLTQHYNKYYAYLYRISSRRDWNVERWRATFQL